MPLLDFRPADEMTDATLLSPHSAACDAAGRASVRFRVVVRRAFGVRGFHSNRRRCELLARPSCLPLVHCGNKSRCLVYEALAWSISE